MSCIFCFINLLVSMEDDPMLKKNLFTTTNNIAKLSCSFMVKFSHDHIFIKIQKKKTLNGYFCFLSPKWVAIS